MAAQAGADDAPIAAATIQNVVGVYRLVSAMKVTDTNMQYAGAHRGAIKAWLVKLVEFGQERLLQAFHNR